MAKTMNRYGVVLVFRPGTTRQEAEAALGKVDHVLDRSYYVRGKPNVNEFDEEYGGPVWYVP